MTYNFSVSPDFNPKHISGWFIFNTWLQKTLAEPIHLELYNDFASQRRAIGEEKLDLIYANPFDAVALVRQQGFIPVARPTDHSDEAIIAVAESHPAQCVEDLQAGLRIATTDDPDVHMMSMIMLEPAGLDKDNTEIKTKDSYVLVAKEVLNGDADAGFFLEATYNDLSSVIRQQLRPLLQSHIQLIHHALLVGPRLAARRGDMLGAMLDMHNHDKGRAVLESIGLEHWQEVTPEDTEFMIDLMETLVKS